MTLDDEAGVCDSQIAYGDETEFYLDMANSQPLNGIGTYANEYKGSNYQSFQSNGESYDKFGFATDEYKSNL